MRSIVLIKKHFFAWSFVVVACAAALSTAHPTVERLSANDESSHIGGAWFRSSECKQTATGVCTASSPVPNEPCTGSGHCDTPSWCIGGLGDASYACTAMYDTNNPFDFVCVVNASVDCPFAARACDGTTCSSLWWGTTSGCGTKTNCSY
jgi:hypothetical protein